ncbi:MFS transporter [Cerasicoccus fimbriatus]|uniref:MFS transporter n=1 Tax=Cerasicoccus fimbriatus TaxID=3014554 RepID=UPI0022B48C85|nr:MFS transporter [Cerasicoccus sp. TK19100]
MKRLFDPNAPFRPSAFPFFYGWVIVAGCTAAMLFSLPGQTAGVGPFKPYMLEALGIESMDLSIAYMIGTIASGLTLPTLGGLFDRMGARKTGVMASLALGVSLLFISQVDRIVLALAGQTTFWLAMPLMVLGFFLIRFWGQGVLSIVSRMMIGKWFDRRRGLASAISGVPVAVAFTSALLILSWVIDLSGGWRQAWIGMALFMFFFCSLFCWLVFRDNPEECGLEIDDGKTASSKKVDAEFVTHRDFTVPEALRTWPFWVFSLAICLNGFVGTAIGFHASTIAGQLGMDAEALYSLIAQTVLINIPVSFVIGWMTSRFRLKYCYLITTFGMALGLFGFMNLPEAWAKVIFVAGFGVSWGTYGTLLTVTWPRYFGLRHLGNISSWVMSLLVVTSALGPVFFDLCEWLTGDYGWAYWASIVAACGFFIACCWMENPQRKLAPAGR